MSKRFVVREVLFEVDYGPDEHAKASDGETLTFRRGRATPVAIGNRLLAGQTEIPPFDDPARGWVPAAGMTFGAVTEEEIREGVIG